MRWNLSKVLRTSIRNLQAKYADTGEAICSDETANELCSNFEAIFLHGRKSSMARKVGKVGVQFLLSFITTVNVLGIQLLERK